MMSLLHKLNDNQNDDILADSFSVYIHLYIYILLLLHDV